jgi:hypothetical protein
MAKVFMKEIKVLIEQKMLMEKLLSTAIANTGKYI